MTAPSLDRPMAQLADGLAIAIVVALPWSSSVVSILAVLWPLALLPTLKVGDVWREVATVAGGLPVALALFAALGMLWADVTWPERLGGLDSFLKLLLIPLLLVQFRRSNRGRLILGGYLVSCSVLLTLSFVSLLWPQLITPGEDVGVPIKNAATQCAEFILCTFVLLFLAIERLRRGQTLAAGAMAALALAFLVNVSVVAMAQIILGLPIIVTVTVALLFVLLALKTLSGKQALMSIGAVAILCAAAWLTSPEIRTRTMAAWNGIQSEPGRWLGSRPGFWQKSLTFIGDRPLFGHGTGSVQSLYTRSVAGPGQATVTINPHQQTLAIGMQLGLAGMAVLWAMWTAHLMLFRGGTLPAWIGLMIVTQTMIGSFAESNLFDFTWGWSYVFGVGVAGGMVRRLAESEIEFKSDYVRDGGAANEHC
jgi:hypothetical protein